MRTETLAVHGGHRADPTYHAVAIPIYQTAAYEFESADHATALFNLEANGYRCNRISNPAVAARERRQAHPERRVDDVAVGSCQAALHDVVMSLAEPGRNIANTPHIYGTTHTLFYDALGNIKRVVSLRDAGSLACHPASTTRRQTTQEQQYAVGIAPEALRNSVGIEHGDDIMADLNEALATVVSQDAFGAELV